ncbi:hypothetical protein H0B56_01005 [Haloechinothrix sp. YIM 98757]|uniref:Uncharacterized protein n=1 Tax=Haloechinothrix aidingensis TaxID=2752311 RepID=A0A838A6S9_9PSEU|nr:hypothetical protein [Haloechinothrix aidingensis]MBA0124117.1 hypothetical protein [Haloechinothrix aidingensis]
MVGDLASGTALLGGLVLLLASLPLLRESLRLRRQAVATQRTLRRTRAAVAEIERVQHARDEVIGSPDSADSDVVRRSYDIISGVPFALLEATPMPKGTVRLLRDAHGAVANSVYSTLWGAGRTIIPSGLPDLSPQPGTGGTDEPSSTEEPDRAE